MNLFSSKLCLIFLLGLSLAAKVSAGKAKKSSEEKNTAVKVSQVKNDGKINEVYFVANLSGEKTPFAETAKVAAGKAEKSSGKKKTPVNSNEKALLEKAEAERNWSDKALLAAHEKAEAERNEREGAERLRAAEKEKAEENDRYIVLASMVAGYEGGILPEFERSNKEEVKKAEEPAVKEKVLRTSTTKSSKGDRF